MTARKSASIGDAIPPEGTAPSIGNRMNQSLPESAAAARLDVVCDDLGKLFDLTPWKCPTCGPVGTRLVGLRGGRYHRYGWGLESPIVRCLGCGLLYPDPFPRPRDPQQLYGDPEKYFERHDRRAKIDWNRQLLAEIARLLGSRTVALLDVGSGRGEALEAGRREGLTDLVGLELSQAMADDVKRHFGFDVILETIETYVEHAGRTFDIVMLNAVLEHVHDPDSMIACCRRLTRAGGVLYVDVPREPNLLTMIGNGFNRLRGDPAVYNLSPTWTPFHVYGFNPRAIRTLLMKHGFTIERIDVHATPQIPHRPAFGDRLKAFAGTQVNRLANLTGLASNMFIWARHG